MQGCFGSAHGDAGANEAARASVGGQDRRNSRGVPRLVPLAACTRSALTTARLAGPDSRSQLIEIPEGAICCGSAGIYNLTQPEAAHSLGDRKAALISELNADVVATGNPGCMLQLQASLDRIGKKIRVMHTVELLDAAME